ARARRRTGDGRRRSPRGAGSAARRRRPTPVGRPCGRDGPCRRDARRRGGGFLEPGLVGGRRRVAPIAVHVLAIHVLALAAAVALQLRHDLAALVLADLLLGRFLMMFQLEHENLQTRSALPSASPLAGTGQTSPASRPSRSPEGGCAVPPTRASDGVW